MNLLISLTIHNHAEEKKYSWKSQRWMACLGVIEGRGKKLIQAYSLQSVSQVNVTVEYLLFLNTQIHSMLVSMYLFFFILCCCWERALIFILENIFRSPKLIRVLFKQYVLQGKSQVAFQIQLVDKDVFRIPCSSIT